MLWSSPKKSSLIRMGYKSNDANQEPPRIFLFTTVSLSQVFLSNKKLNSTCSFPLRSTKKCVSTLCLYLTDGLPEKRENPFFIGDLLRVVCQMVITTFSLVFDDDMFCSTFLKQAPSSSNFFRVII